MLRACNDNKSSCGTNNSCNRGGTVGRLINKPLTLTVKVLSLNHGKVKENEGKILKLSI